MLPIQADFPDRVLETGNYLDLEFVIVINPLGYRCGYVAITKPHDFYGKSSEDCNSLAVYGKITYSARDKHDPNKWWLGFDCGHAEDKPDATKITNVKIFKDTLARIELLDSVGYCWTVKDNEFVRKKINSLIIQLKAYG